MIELRHFLRDTMVRHPRALWLIVIAGLARSAVTPLASQAAFGAWSPEALLGGLLVAAGLVVIGHLFEARGSAALDRALSAGISARTHRVVSATRGATLRDIERRPGLSDALVRILQRLDEMYGPVRGYLIAGAQLVGYAAYVAVVSPWALVVCVLGGALIARIDRRQRAARVSAVATGQAAWRGFDAAIEPLYGCFPRLRLDHRAMHDAVRDAVDARSETARVLTAADAALAVSRVEGAVVPLIVVGFVLALLPALPGIDGATAASIGAVVLMGRSAASTVGDTSDLAEVEAALAALRALEGSLEPDPPARGAPAAFERVRFEHVGFTFDDGFTIGPIDLELRRGELIFIVGPNGSGKTTFMKLVAGLYRSPTGRVWIDDRPVDPAALRELSSAVFADGHLFDRAYGLDVDDDGLEAALADVGLTDALSVEDGRFSTLRLSSGQRARLGLMVGLLEQRPVLILDEWDAHQDPETTHRYFDERLPALAARGFTVLAVCHDERFFDLGHRVLRFADGRAHIHPAEPASRPS